MHCKFFIQYQVIKCDNSVRGKPLSCQLILRTSLHLYSICSLISAFFYTRYSMQIYRNKFFYIQVYYNNKILTFVELPTFTHYSGHLQHTFTPYILLTSHCQLRFNLEIFSLVTPKKSAKCYRSTMQLQVTLKSKCFSGQFTTKNNPFKPSLSSPGLIV